MFLEHELNHQIPPDATIFNNSTDLLSSDSLLKTGQELFNSQNFYTSSNYFGDNNIFSDELINLTSLDVDTFTTEKFVETNTSNLISPDNFNLSLNELGENYDELTGERITTNEATNDNSAQIGKLIDNLKKNFPQFSTLIDNLKEGFDKNNKSTNNSRNNLSQVSKIFDNLTSLNTFNFTQIISGNLYANTFNVNPEIWSRKVILGNGNVNFGSGYRDTLDLSKISFNSIIFSPANMKGGGVAYNPGNGERIFDAIYVKNYHQLILFEGIDTIRFADKIVNLSVTPNDPYFNQQWNLHMMGVHNAWRFTQGSDKVMVGIQDSGLGADNAGNIHPDLKVPDSIPSNIRDDYSSQNTSHGTYIQGIIAARSNNGVDMSGINWNSDVINIDVVDKDKGDWNLAAATQEMINWANQKGKRLVINLSLSQTKKSQDFISPELERFVASNPNVLFVVSSGNDNKNKISAPAILAHKYNNVMAIGASWGASDRNGNSTIPGQRISYFSGSKIWGSNYGIGLTLMGPSEVIATRAKKENGIIQFDIDEKFDGTSAAAPNVTGVASLVWSVNPNLSAAQVRQIMSETAYDLGNAGYDYEYGHGFVNADASVRRALAISGSNA